MNWAKELYTQKSKLFGQAVVNQHHRKTADLLHQWCSELKNCKNVLELGAGAGGVAAAMSDLAYDVWAVEFNPEDSAHARTLAETKRKGDLTIVEEDFYEVNFNQKFDFIYYWDGFGIGTDADQRRLLQKIAEEWLKEGGFAMIDVFSPWNWQKRDGAKSSYKAKDGSIWQRVVEFDALGNRFIDHFRPMDERDVNLSQNIRLYSIPDFYMLVEGTGLKVETIYTMDLEIVDLSVKNKIVSDKLLNTNGYYAKLVKK